jgi:hypothetical protein
MKKLNCSDTFIEYQKKRLSYPLPRGVYKLKETASRLEAYKEEIARIKDYKLNKSIPTMLHCVADDAHIWLKQIPHLISEKMGYNVVPAIPALCGDRVPQILISKIENFYAPLIKNLIVRCDFSWATIKKCIRYEYWLWRNGHSRLIELIDEALDIIDGLLIDARHPRKALYIGIALK